eukprot:TRINITY_DN2452_c0_g1_i1.p1 TRINITY_DN2452_c0_g1~~TRINITY_DN2452_c0_g1_i1.p1  ORF type:complete len:445 (-),score=155.29 TRINITY_DN2452_c0_g1_i1:29-1363(-)
MVSKRGYAVMDEVPTTTEDSRFFFGNQPGQAEVQLGLTKVYVVTTSEIVEPFPDRPTEGFFTFNTEFSPMASPFFEPGRPSEAAIELGRVVERALRESRAIDTEALCIIAGQQVWSIRVDMHVLDHNGNLIDCASIAAVTSLLHFRRPDVVINGDVATTVSPKEKEPVALSIHHTPICVTFGLFKDGEHIVVDPSLKEEAVMDGRMTIALNEFGEICAVQKAGGTPIAIEKIIECSRIAAVKVVEIVSIIKAALKSPKPMFETQKLYFDFNPVTLPAPTGKKGSKKQKVSQESVEKQTKTQESVPMETTPIVSKQEQPKAQPKNSKKPVEEAEEEEKKTDKMEIESPKGAPKKQQQKSQQSQEKEKEKGDETTKQQQQETLPPTKATQQSPKPPSKKSSDSTPTSTPTPAPTKPKASTPKTPADDGVIDLSVAIRKKAPAKKKK